MSEENWRIGHLDHLESPFGNAGGVVKKPEDVEKMAKTGVGWIEHGTTTLEKRYGNGKDEAGNQLYIPGTDIPVNLWHYDAATGEMWNSLGMDGDGMDQVEQDIPEMNAIAEAHSKTIIYNVAPVTSEPVEEAQELAVRAYEKGAKAILLNAGCPNVIVEGGGRKEVLCYNAHMLGKVLRGLVEVGVGSKYPRAFVRTSPYASYDDAKTAYRIIEASRAISAAWTPNSWGNQPVPEDENGRPVIQVPGNVAGKTGPATADDAAWQTELAVRIFNGSGINAVQSGGIANYESDKVRIRAAEQLQRALGHGAVGGAGTTFFYTSKNGWKYDVDKTLHEFAEIS